MYANYEILSKCPVLKFYRKQSCFCLHSNRRQGNKYRLFSGSICLGIFLMKFLSKQKDEIMSVFARLFGYSLFVPCAFHILFPVHLLVLNYSIVINILIALERNLKQFCKRFVNFYANFLLDCFCAFVVEYSLTSCSFLSVINCSHSEIKFC